VIMDIAIAALPSAEYHCLDLDSISDTMMGQVMFFFFFFLNW
jgi:hypothetical protein